MSEERNLRVLFVGDAPTVDTGFGRVMREVTRRIAQLSEVDVAILGWNSHGDPSDFPVPVWAAGFEVGGHRLAEVVGKFRPDVVCVISDIWVVNEHTKILADLKDPQTGGTYEVPCVAYTLLDGVNLHPRHAEKLARCASVGVACANAEREIRDAGYEGRTWVAEYGVDPELFEPIDRGEARRRCGLAKRVGEGFVFGAVNRNAPRKRFDLTIDYFADWWRRAGKPSDAWLYIHAANEDIGWDLIQLAEYHGVLGRLVIPLRLVGNQLKAWHANLRLPVEEMRYVYSSIDVGISTAIGEGFGLPCLEGMACGVPQIAAAWAALDEWPGDSIVKVPCSTALASEGGYNVMGGIVDREPFIAAMDRLYRSAEERALYRMRGLVRAKAFRWERTAMNVVRELAAAAGASVEVKAA